MPQISKSRLYALIACLGLLGSVAAHGQIIDDFNRSDSSNLGNGWIEKSPNTFLLNAGAVEKQVVGTSYRDNIVFRPANENVLNVETSVEMQLSSLPPGYAQILARVQTDTALDFNSFDGYILYTNYFGNEAILGRQNADDFVIPFASISISPALNNTDTYRLRLSVSGTNPVNLVGSVDRFNGATWDVIGQAIAADSSAQRIDTAGSVGFGGSSFEVEYGYDNFARVDLDGGSGNNPQPQLTSINPSAAGEGDPAFALTVNGSDFVSSSVVRWNGQDRATTFVSANELSAAITAADVATAGTATVTVFTPAPGGGISAGQTFTIAPVVVNNPQPVIASINPSTATEGDPAFALTVNGSDFVSSSVVRWNGQDRATTFVSANELSAAITAADVATAGTATVTVFTPAPGGGISAGQTFTIDPVVVNNPQPVIAGINPSTATEGDPAFALTVNGSDFVSSSVVRWNGQDRATTFVSANELSAAITAADVATAGTATVTVFTPAPGGGISAGQTFTIDPVVVNNPQPVIASINPSTATEGDPAFALTVNGSDFVSSSVVRWNGQDRQTTYVSANELMTAITSADIATAGSAAVTVFTPAPGGGLSNSTIFSINSASGSGQQIIDDFNRSDSSNLGSGWIEKSPSTFSLNAGAVEKLSVGTSYRDNIVFRPANENVLNVETSVEMQLSSLPPGYAQILARVQTDTALDFNSFDGYILYTNYFGNEAILGRQNADDFVIPFASISISPALNNTDTYRLRLSVSGTNPVNLVGSVDRFNGATWDVIGQAIAADSSAQRIDTAGSVGFGGSSFEVEYGYDNFARVDLDGGSGNNPQPQLTSINPSAAGEGDPAFALTVNGSDFVSSSVVRWNGQDRATTFVSANELSAAITAADVATAGTATVTVFTPAPGGGISAGQTFTIDPVVVNNPQPVIASINPSTATEGDPAFALTVNGSDFVSSSVVRWNGQDRATTFVSANELSAAITAADVATAGTATVTVFTPAPGGGISAGQTFTIDPVVVNNPQPVIASINPSTATEGDPAFALTVNGSDFVSSSVVRWNGQDRATTFVSANELSAAITAADVATAETATVTVFTPAPGGGLSGINTFTILEAGVGTNPVPTLGGFWPVELEAGSGAAIVAVWGSNYVNSSQVLWDGQPRQTIYSSNQEVLLLLSAADVAAAGNYDIQVVNPAPGGGTTAAISFAVTPATGNPYAPTMTDVSPASWPVNGGSVMLTVSGTNFAPNSVVQWNGAQRPTIYVNDQTLEVTLAAPDVAIVQNASLAVSTPAPGGGTSHPQTFFVLDPAVGYFYDNFNRADSTIIGNGWAEKSDIAFRLLGGEVVSTETALDYRENVFYRPLAEDRQDVEVSVELRRLLPTGNLAQVHARSQRSVIENPESIESYIFFVNDIGQDPIEAAIAIQDPISFAECFISTVQFPSAMQFDERYRLRFRVSGTAPVQLDGFVDHWNGQSWDLFASGSTVHDVTTQPDPGLFCGPGFMPPPITGPGASGVSKFRGRSDAYDNFYWQDYVPNPGVNPVPVINSLSPGSATTGDGDLNLTVNGVNFVAGSVVRWNGADRQTTFVAANQLTALIPAQDLSQATVADVTVLTSAPGGGESAIQTFAVQDPNPGSPNVLDDFERPDSPMLGNGWVEKNPGAFILANGAAAKQLVSESYRDNIAFRPASESLLNVETSVEFRLGNVPPGYVQLFARVQTDTALDFNAFDGYILYINYFGNNAILGRQNADDFVVPFASINIFPQLNANDLYRLRMTVENTASVDLGAFIERWSGTSWDVIGQAAATDSGPNRITSAGSFGFGGHVEGNYEYDNFNAQDLDQ